MTEPFVQLPYEDLPAQPSRPHGFLELPVHRVDVTTEALGTVSTAYRRVGSGRPLVLLHGLMTTGYSWRYVLDALAADHDVIVPDLPGAGDTPCPDASLGPEAVADWFVALLDALDVRGAEVVGNSMGGYLSMWAALRHPEALGRLVQLHGPGVPLPRLWALWAAIRLPGSEALLGALVRRDPRRWAHHHVHYWDESLKSVEEATVYGDVLATEAGLRGFHRQLRDMMDVRGLRRFVRALEARRAAGQPFPVPLLLLYARRDPMVPPEVGARLAALVPDATLSWLDEGSHFAHVDAPEAFLDAARAFLS